MSELEPRKSARGRVNEPLIFLAIAIAIPAGVFFAGSLRNPGQLFNDVIIPFSALILICCVIALIAACWPPSPSSLVDHPAASSEQGSPVEEGVGNPEFFLIALVTGGIPMAGGAGLIYAGLKIRHRDGANLQSAPLGHGKPHWTAASIALFALGLLILVPSGLCTALVGGSIATYDVVRPLGGAITSSVNVPGSNSLLRQASGTSTVFGSWQPGGGVSMRGTVIGSVQ